jgi:hypothetical protein
MLGWRAGGRFVSALRSWVISLVGVTRTLTYIVVSTLDGDLMRVPEAMRISSPSFSTALQGLHVFQPARQLCAIILGWMPGSAGRHTFLG